MPDNQQVVPGLKTNITPGKMIDNTIDIILKTQLAARGVDIDNEEQIRTRVSKDLILPEGRWVYKLDGVPILTFAREQVGDRMTAFSLTIEPMVQVH